LSSLPGAHFGLMASPSGRRVLTDWKAFQATSENIGKKLRALYAGELALVCFASAELITKQ